MSSKIMSLRRRGRIGKSETRDQVTLERRLLFREYQLVWNREKCIGCGICVDMCPKEAMLYIPAQFKAGRRVSDRPRIDFDPDKCVLCGECVVSCPMDQALIMKVDGKKFVPVIDVNAFAMVTRKTSL
jgi:4Fe-4S ferredoxin